MIKIRFVAHDGSSRDVAAEPGISLMEAARNNGVDGIDADCGGVCACATCHVYIDPAWADRVPPRGSNEADMLDMAEDVQASSRLACQIRLEAALDGLVAHLPQYQR